MLPVLLVVYARRIKPAAALALFIATLFAVPMLPSSLWTRLASITDESKDETGSRESRRIAMREAFETFLAHPVTGVGAGQFKNYDPLGRQEHWREAHNAPLQVAAELGIFGVGVFGFLIVYAFIVLRRTRARLRASSARTRRWIRTAPAPAVDPHADERPERDLIHAHAGAVLAGLTGWFVCAQFASVAYSWTFYYLLALAVVDYMNAQRLAAGPAGGHEPARPGMLRRPGVARRAQPLPESA
jgi:O-antigen ligase